MEYLTIGQVLDQIEIGMVAIPIEVMSGDVPYGEGGRVYCNLPMYLDEDDYYLKAIDGRRITGFLKPPEVVKGKFVLVSKEKFETMIDSIKNIADELE